MKIQTIINRFPRFNGYHIYNITKEQFVPARVMRELVDSYHQHYWETQPPELWHQMSAEEKWDFFREEFLSFHDDYVLIEIPINMGFGIMMPEPKEYVEQLKEVLQ